MEPSEKVLSNGDAAQRAAELRAAGKRLVTVNGSFDLLHAGHLVILEEAKAQGDVLFVGLNSDVSVKQYKGPERPIVLEGERARLLAALACVDCITLIDAPEAAAVIVELVRPQVHVNGSEYGPPEQWVEYPVLRRYGVVAHVCERRPALATTDLIRRIQTLRAP